MIPFLQYTHIIISVVKTTYEKNEDFQTKTGKKSSLSSSSCTRTYEKRLNIDNK